MRPAKKVIDTLAKAKWRSSGIEDKTADRLGLEELSPEETKEAINYAAEVRTLKLPYFDLQGARTEFFRLRYLEQLPGFGGLVEKPQRYVQPKALNEPYLAPILDKSWAEIAKDPEVSLAITEGELKAAVGCQAGVPTIGLGGVDVWRAQKVGVPLLPMLGEFEWKNRLVVIVYDSDAHVNPNVVRAQNQLARELTAHGAVPSIASLAPRADGSKQGLDDFLLGSRDPKSAYLALLEEALPVEEAAALWELNEEVAYVHNPGVVVVRDTGRLIRPGDFISHAYANRHYALSVTDKTGTHLKSKPLAPRWVEWEHRAELREMEYLPGAERYADGAYNTWPGWACEPKKGDVACWTGLLNYLFKSQAKERQWFEQWCAYPFQHPGEKLYTSVLVWGLVHGTGKSFVAYMLGMIYGNNFVEIKNKDLKGNFNGWAARRQFVYGDEITGGDRATHRIDADWLKGLITQPRININAKYTPEYTLPDRINYYFTSNHPDAFFIEGDDRRFFVHEVVGPPASRPFYEACDAWVKSPEGGPALFHHLLTLDLTGFNPREHAPFTRAKQDMIEGGRSDLGEWCAMLRVDPTMQLMSLGERAGKECEVWNAKQLLRAYDPDGRSKINVVIMGRELKRAGVAQLGVVRTSVGAQRLYAVRRWDHWSKRGGAEVAAHWEQFFGEGTKKF
jgi:hypothetical protein